jgi:hypothetical protein
MDPGESGARAQLRPKFCARNGSRIQDISDLLDELFRNIRGTLVARRNRSLDDEVLNDLFEELRAAGTKLAA